MKTKKRLSAILLWSAMFAALSAVGLSSFSRYSTTSVRLAYMEAIQEIVGIAPVLLALYAVVAVVVGRRLAGPPSANSIEAVPHATDQRPTVGESEYRFPKQK